MSGEALFELKKHEDIPCTLNDSVIRRARRRKVYSRLGLFADAT